MTYLPAWFHISSAILLFIIYLINGFVFFPLLVIYAVASLLFRKKRSHYNYKETPSFTTRGLVFAPVSGILRFSYDDELEVFGEKQNVKVVGLAVPWWREQGVYMPMTGEVESFNSYKGASRFRFSKESTFQAAGSEFSGCQTNIYGAEGQKVGLGFVKCPLGMAPKIWAMPGDRGRRQAPMGFFPLGGTVLIYLPENYKILPKIGENLNSGESVLAADSEREMS